MADDTNMLNLKLNQQNQILDQYRMTMYNQDLRHELVVKMLEEKGIFSGDEFKNRWPIYLKNDIGVVGPNGMMEGTLRVKFYGNN